MNLYDRKYFFETDGKHFLFPFIYSAYYVLVNRGCKVFTTNDFEKSLPNYEEGDVVFGSVELCKTAFQKSGVEIPKYLGYPDELKSFYGRQIATMNYSEAMNEPLPVFIKPKDNVKEFTGTLFAVEEDKWRTITLNGHEDSMFYVQGKIDIFSEWRVFVHNGNIYACQCYDGDRLDFPHKNRINRMVEIYDSLDNSPCAYTLDVGIDRYGTTFLIEINDMWGTGIYGAPDYEYTMAYIDRWLEIINK